MYKNFLAPIHQYSDLPFRQLCRKYGAEATCVPMINAIAVTRSRNALSKLLDIDATEKNTGVQLVGDDPVILGNACRIILENYDNVEWLNLNCGCPSPRTMKCGGGSAMLGSPTKIANVVSAMRKVSDIPISVKMRIKSDEKQTLEICRIIEANGADFMIIHGRTTGQGYSGKCNWKAIKALKEATSIPIIGNGDIQSSSEGKEMVRNGYCNSFMIGRAAMSNPLAFIDKKPGTIKEKFDLIAEYAGLCEHYYGTTDIKLVKAKALQMIRGIHNAASIRKHIIRSKTVESILFIPQNM